MMEIFKICLKVKNETDETAIKHKNEDFFKGLDKDNDYYNVGIVDV